METQTFIGATEQEAEKLAREFMATLDTRRQPNIWGRKETNLPNGETLHSVTVRFWGLD